MSSRRDQELEEERRRLIESLAERIRRKEFSTHTLRVSLDGDIRDDSLPDEKKEKENKS